MVELEPAVVERRPRAARRSTTTSLRNPKVRLIDRRRPRGAARPPDERYDIIFSEPSNPYRAGDRQPLHRGVLPRPPRAAAPGRHLPAVAPGLRGGRAASCAPSTPPWAPSSRRSRPGRSTRRPAAASPAASRSSTTSRRVRARAAAASPTRSALDWTWGVEGAEGFYTGFMASPALRAGPGARRSGAGSTPTTGRSSSSASPATSGGSACSDRSDLAALARARGAGRPAARRRRSTGRLEESCAARAWRSGGRRSAAARPGLAPAAAARIAGARRPTPAADLAAPARAGARSRRPPVLDLDRLLVAECLAAAGDPRAPGTPRRCAGAAASRRRSCSPSGTAGRPRRRRRPGICVAAFRGPRARPLDLHAARWSAACSSRSRVGDARPAPRPRLSRGAGASRSRSGSPTRAPARADGAGARHSSGPTSASRPSPPSSRTSPGRRPSSPSARRLLPRRPAIRSPTAPLRDLRGVPRQRPAAAREPLGRPARASLDRALTVVRMSNTLRLGRPRQRPRGEV